MLDQRVTWRALSSWGHFDVGQTSFAKYVAKLIDEREKEGDTSSPFLAHAVAVCADQAVIAALEGFSASSAALPEGGMAAEGSTGR